MKTQRTSRRSREHRKRTALATLEVVMSLAVVFTATVVMYRLAVIACHKLHHIIAGMVGSPYL
jgi:hypothetical protein